MGCLQAQYAPSMYIGLWSRVEGFPRDDLTRLLDQRAVVQGTLMRVTIHVVSAADYWPLALAVREARRTLWLRATRHAATPADYEEAAIAVRGRLAAGPVRRAELDQLVGRDKTIGVGLWVNLVRVPPSGTWERRRADLYGLAEEWLGPPPEDLTVEAVTAHLVRRYLRGFGPATAADVADWGGLRTGDVQQVLDLAVREGPGRRAPVRTAPPGRTGRVHEEAARLAAFHA